MVHEPRWELHSHMGGHEEHILEEVPRLLQIQWRYFRYDTRGR